MADEEKQSPFTESMFPWMKTAADLWLNMAKAMPPNSDSTLRTQTAVQNRFTEQLENKFESAQIFLADDERTGIRVGRCKLHECAAGNLSEDGQIGF